MITSKLIGTTSVDGRDYDLWEADNGRAYYVMPKGKTPVRLPTELYTVYTKDETCKRGEYAEEIDVLTRDRSVAQAKRAAQAAINLLYEPTIRPARVVYRRPGIMFI